MLTLKATWWVSDLARSAKAAGRRARPCRSDLLILCGIRWQELHAYMRMLNAASPSPVCMLSAVGAG